MSEVMNVWGDECWGDECRTIGGHLYKASNPEKAGCPATLSRLDIKQRSAAFQLMDDEPGESPFVSKSVTSKFEMCAILKYIIFSKPPVFAECWHTKNYFVNWDSISRKALRNWLTEGLMVSQTTPFVLSLWSFQNGNQLSWAIPGVEPIWLLGRSSVWKTSLSLLSKWFTTNGVGQ